MLLLCKGCRNRRKIDKMFKKIGCFLKMLFTASFWTLLWTLVSRQIILYIWNFDFVSQAHWKLIAEFWQKNGTIKSFSDYMLFLTLFLVLLLWYKGVKYFYKLDYLRLMLKPFEYFSNQQIEKYKKEGKHVVIKNLIVGKKITVDDLIAEKIKEENSQQQEKQADQLRQTLSQKINERKGK